MSPSTFRQHFRALTGVSPLQYQKQLRLQEARQLMLNENLDAGSAGGRVGYESPSQFSREYSRLFGAPPQRDVTRMRLAPVAAASPRQRRLEVRGSWKGSTPSIDPTVARIAMNCAVAGTCEKIAMKATLASMTSLGRPRTTLALKCVKPVTVRRATGGLTQFRRRCVHARL